MQELLGLYLIVQNRRVCHQYLLDAIACIYPLGKKQLMKHNYSYAAVCDL